MTWLRASLYHACPGVSSLLPVELADHITISCQTLQRQLVSNARAHPATLSPTYIFKQAQPYWATPAKKENPAERWDLQAPSLCRLANVKSPEYLTLIWHTLAPLTKEKARPTFDVACRERAPALGYKASRVTHTVAVLLLFTEDPDCVNDTLNIFQFPDLYLYAGSESSMVT